MPSITAAMTGCWPQYRLCSIPNSLSNWRLLDDYQQAKLIVAGAHDAPGRHCGSLPDTSATSIGSSAAAAATVDAVSYHVFVNRGGSQRDTNDVQ
jgi:hypothetical protein